MTQKEKIILLILEGKTEDAKIELENLAKFFRVSIKKRKVEKSEVLIFQELKKFLKGDNAISRHISDLYNLI